MIASRETGLRSAKYSGVSLLILLTASLYPIYLKSGFSSSYLVIAYDCLFALALRLILAGDVSRLQRVGRALVASTLAALVVVCGAAVLTNFFGAKRAYEEGFGVSVVVIGAYIGVPIIFLTCLLSAIPLRATGRGNSGDRNSEDTIPD
jgi:hypothetical protein